MSVDIRDKNIMYIVHFKDGTTRTIHDGEPGAPYPDQLDTAIVSSIERVVNGIVYSIKNHPDIDHFFVKASAEFDFNPQKGGASTRVTERILGFELNGYALELIINTTHNHCKLVIKKKVT